VQHLETVGTRTNSCKPLFSRFHQKLFVFSNLSFILLIIHIIIKFDGEIKTKYNIKENDKDLSTN